MLTGCTLADMLRLALIGLLFAGCASELAPAADHREQIVGSWVRANNEPAAYPADVNVVSFEATGVYANVWRHPDGTTDVTPGAWDITLDGVQIATTERGTVTIVSGNERQSLDYIVDGLDTPYPRLWLESTLFVR